MVQSNFTTIVLIIASVSHLVPQHSYMLVCYVGGGYGGYDQSWGAGGNYNGQDGQYKMKGGRGRGGSGYQPY